MAVALLRFTQYLQQGTRIVNMAIQYQIQISRFYIAVRRHETPPSRMSFEEQNVTCHSWHEKPPPGAKVQGRAPK